MAGIVQAGQKLVTTALGAVTAGGKAALVTGKSLVSGGGGIAGGVAGAANSVGGSALGWVTVPFTMLKAAFTKMPMLMTLGVGATGLYMFSGMSRRSAERRARAEALQQAAAMQAAAPQISYKNTVSAAETAALDAKMSAGKPEGFAAAELAARETADKSASAKA